MKGSTWVLFFMLILAFVNPMALKASDLQVVTHEMLPIISKVEIDRLGHGFGMDIALAIFEEAKIDVSIDYVPMLRAFKMFQHNRFPVYIGSSGALVSHGLDKDSFYSISAMQFNVVLGYFKSHHKKDITFNSLSDLQGHTVGAIIGSIMAERLKKNGITIDYAPKQESLVKKLFFRRNDLWLTTNFSAIYLTRKYYSGSFDDLKFIDPPLARFSGDICIHKKTPNSVVIAEQLKSALTRIQKNGTYRDILKKYFGCKIPFHVLSKETLSNIRANDQKYFF